MEFVKVHGTGNDFILLPDLDGLVTLDAELTRALCDRRAGLGADGVIRLAPAERADVFMDYRNADGSVAEMCGNGVRCVAKYLVDRGIVQSSPVRVDTRAGTKLVEVVERHVDGSVALVRVDMGAPLATGTIEVDVSPQALVASGRAPSLPPGLELAATAEQRTATVTTVSMGNPHAVFVVDDVAAAPVGWVGPYIERHEAFPGGTNVEFLEVPEPGRLAGRIWERGVGETRASGTGAAAMAVAAHLRGLTPPLVTVVLPGGELTVDWTGETLHVTGPAVEVASGHLDAGWLAGLRAAPLEGAR